MQKLNMPFTRCMMLCGYKNKKYLAYWGYNHYGVDISTIQGNASDDHRILASGEGVVVAAGRDSKLGYALAIQYNDVLNHNTGKVINVVARYMHMKSISVSKGDKVKAGTVIGVEGKEGTGDYHLHLEFDTDLNYPQYTPQVAGGTFWKKGVDTTVNPSFILHVGKNQSLAEPTYNPEWLNAEDFKIPKSSVSTGGGSETEVDKEAELRKLVEDFIEKAKNLI